MSSLPLENETNRIGNSTSSRLESDQSRDLPGMVLSLSTRGITSEDIETLKARFSSSMNSGLLVLGPGAKYSLISPRETTGSCSPPPPETTGSTTFQSLLPMASTRTEPRSSENTSSTTLSPSSPRSIDMLELGVWYDFDSNCLWRCPSIDIPFVTP